MDMWFLQPGMTIDRAITIILSLLLTIFVILPVHEWAHGFVAYKLGDNTAKYSGRLTLNPLRHIDLLGAAAMILFRFGWAKPVPVDPRNFKHPKLDMALTALAGPVSNLLSALVAALLLNSLRYFAIELIPYGVLVFVATFLYSFININVGLAVFNLIPLPPLDGSKVLGVFLPDSFLRSYYQYERYIMIAVFVLLFTDILSVPLIFCQRWAMFGVEWLAKLPFLLLG